MLKSGTITQFKALKIQSYINYRSFMVRKQLTFGILITIILALFTIQCSDSPSSGVDDDIPESDDPEPVVNQACENLKILSQSAKPTNIISVEGFSEEFGEDAYGWLIDPENPDERNPIAFYPDFSSETADFALPLHPVNQLEGGAAEIEIVQQNEDFTCSGFSFTVEALTPNPGASEELFDSYKNGLENVITALGYDPDELNDKTVDMAEPALVPVLMAYHTIESDIFENDLASFIDGTAPALNGEQLTPEQSELIDAIIAESGFATILDEFFQSYLTNIASGLNNQRQRSDTQLYKQNTYEIYSPEFVSSLMKIQKDAEEDVTGIKGASIQAAALTTGLVSLVAGIAALGTAGGAAPVAVASGYASSAISVSYFLTKGIADMLPSNLVFLELVATKATFAEDYDDIAGWDNVMVVEGRGFSVSITDIISFLPTGKVFELKKVTGAIGEINAKLLEILAEVNVTVASVYDDSGVLEFNKIQWGVLVNPERENEKEYFTWEIDFLSAWDNEPPVFAFCTECHESANLGFFPLKQGEAELRVEAKAEPFNFPTNPVQTQKVVVNPIEIIVAPQSNSFTVDEVKAGATVEYQAEVYEAIDKQLEWSADDGFFSYNDDLAHNVTYHPPKKRGSYTITAEAVTETGPREGREPPRTETARVYVEEEGEGCAHFDSENAKTVRVEASGPYNNDSKTADFSISYALADVDPETETGCGDSGGVFEDDISLPWSFQRRMSPPFSASINIVGLRGHTNNMTLTIYVDDEAVAEYTVDGFLEDGEVEPEESLSYAE